MSILSRIPDYGERIGSDGWPVEEFFEVLAQIPADVGIDGLMLACAIARHRCDGRGDVAGALDQWKPEGEAH